MMPASGDNSLSRIELLASLSGAELEALAQQCVFRTYEAGETIFEIGDEARDVRFVIAGQARVLVSMMEGREVIFNDHGPGEMFGELGVVDGGARSASVVAQTRSQIAAMSDGVFRRLCHAHPKVGWAMLEHMSSHVRRLSNRLSEFSFLKARHRIHSELLRLSRPRGGDSEERIITPVPRQTDIADRIASRREIVSREMKALEREGLLRRERGGLVIVQPREIERLLREGWSGEG